MPGILVVLGELGGVLLAPFLFIFILYFVKSKWANRILTYVVLFSVSFILYVWMMEFTPGSFENMIRTPWGWGSTTGMSLPVMLSWLWSNILQIGGCFLCWNFYKKTKDATEKKRTLFVIMGILIPALISLFVVIIVPLLKIESPIADHFFRILLSFSSIILVGVIAYAISKYKLFISLTPAATADVIVETMIDPLMVTDSNMSIEFINDFGSRLLGYSKEDLFGCQIESLLSDKKENIEKFKTQILSEIKKGNDIIGVEIDLLTKGKEVVPVSFSASLVKSIQGETIGIVYIARDIRKIKELINSLEAKVKERTTALESERKNLEEKVGQRTKELEKERKELAEKLVELEKFQKLAVGREMKMIELKSEIDKLKGEGK